MIRLFLFILFSLTACAQPKYVTAAENVGPGARAGAAETTCAARFTDGNCVSLQWETMPTETDFGSFLFKTFRPNAADGSPVPMDLSGAVSVVLWMPSMGHGSSPVTVERLDVGTYRASRVFFTMKGDWEIRVQRKSSDGAGVEDQAVVPFTL